MSLITLTTDFGAGSCYVAAMKGVIYCVDPQANIVDLSHQVPPQNLRFAAFYLNAAVPFFPAGTVHVVVVDPGVGSDRGILGACWRDQTLIVPDNGCCTALFQSEPPRRLIRLTEKKYWRESVSATFHGRDIFAPVAGHLSRGLNLNELGERVESWTALELPRPVLTETLLQGEIVFVDDFGNLSSNIPGEALACWRGKPVRISVGAHQITQRVRTYADAAVGTPVALISSMNTVEIAVVQGNAAKTLGVGEGAPVCIESAQARRARQETA